MSGALRAAVGLCIAVALAPGASAATKARGAPAPASAASASAAASAPIEFAGVLEAGRTYVADFSYDAYALHIWRPVKDMQVAKNTAWTIEWTNLDQFPALKSASTRAKPQRFLFKVVKAEVASGSPVMPWTTVYRCELLSVEGSGGASAPAGKRR